MEMLSFEKAFKNPSNLPIP